MRNVFLFAAAIIAGFLGGIVGSRTFQSRDVLSQDLIRARGFELLSSSGHVISYWGIDEGGNSVLAFGQDKPAAGGIHSEHKVNGLRNPSFQRTAIGLLGSDNPFVRFTGVDGKSRVRMYLNDWDKPILMMEDENTPRIALGLLQSDTPGPNDNEWLLNFYPETASIGMYVHRKGAQQYVRGFLDVRRNDVRFP